MSQGPLYIIARIIAIAAVVFILSEYLYFDVTKRGWRNAKKELPTELKKFGLKFKKSELSHQIGTFSGKFNGREVEVLPDSHASIEIKLKNMPEVILNTVKVPKNTGEFKTGVKQFDSFFKSKFAPENVSKKLMQAKKLHTHVEEFHKTWKRPLSFLEVGRYKIRCAMKYGQQTYIPPKKIEELLSDLCEMADLLEEVLRLDNLKKAPIKGIVKKKNTSHSYMARVAGRRPVGTGSDPKGAKIRIGRGFSGPARSLKPRHQWRVIARRNRQLISTFNP